MLQSRAPKRERTSLLQLCGKKVRSLLSLMHFQKSSHILKIHRFQLLVELSKWKPLLLLPLQGYLCYFSTLLSVWRLQCLNTLGLWIQYSGITQRKWETPVWSKLARYLECVYYSIPCKECATRTLLWSIRTFSVHLRIYKSIEVGLKTDLHLLVHMVY